VKEKSSEWVSISDLMSGVTAVVMLLLVISVVQKTYAEVRHKNELKQGVAAQEKIVAKMLDEMIVEFNRNGASNMVDIDVTGHKITLQDSVFSRGSACITPEARSAMSSIQGQISEYLLKVKLGQIFIEGHTDSIQVSKPVVDYEKYCTVYDDNYTLSAARAREARKLLLGNLSEQDAKRIIVAGYGDSHTLPDIPPTDSKNRRVDVLFSVQ
jgi:chemotaxis protein MotB